MASKSDDFAKTKIAYCKIFPPVGIARVGDSREHDGCFIGPEFPGQEMSKRPGFSFRDAEGHIKRQAARFRIFAFDADDNVLGELTAAEATIVWSVSLANKKPAWFEFRGTDKALAVYRGERGGQNGGPDLPSPRNASTGRLELRDGSWKPTAERAKLLEIHGGTVEISGRSKVTVQDNPGENYGFVGEFKKTILVNLGELRTDEDGRLIVLGGHGVSDAVDQDGRSIRDLRWIRNYANNDDWYDDVSDGPISAKVEVDSQELEVRGGAWVIVAPPDFAPDVTNVVTLFDVMEEVALLNDDLASASAIMPRAPSRVFFETDIAPIMRRVSSYRWVTEKGLRGHGAAKPGDFTKKNGTEPTLRPAMDDLASPTGGLTREKVFSTIRQPAYARGPNRPDSYSTERAVAQATTVFMPPLAGDEGDPIAGNPATWLSLTYLQHDRLKEWSAGNFHVGADPVLADRSPAKIAIEDLTRSALEACAGGAFYPGIEMTCIARERSVYCEAFRLSHEVLEAGDVTKFMAVPWQADFYECRDHWWPAQRPDDILGIEEFDLMLAQFKEEAGGHFIPLERVLFNRKRWDRGIGIRPRPTNEYLKSRILPTPTADETAAEYIARVTAPKPKGRSFDSMAGLLLSLTPVEEIQDATSEWKNGESGEHLPSPWRLQYLAQSALDSYSGLYFHPLVPSPAEAIRRVLTPEKPGPCGVTSPDDLRREWNVVRLTEPAAAAGILGKYADTIAEALTAQVRSVLGDHPLAAASADSLVAALVGTSVADFEGDHPEDFQAGSAECKELRALEMVQQIIELLYVTATNWAGDMSMVDQWRKLGFVVETIRGVTQEDGTPVNDGAGNPIRVAAQVETGRAPFDGLSFRDYFYLLMNIEDHQDFIPYAKRIVNDILADAQRLIDAIGISDTQHPESSIEYSKASLGAKLEEIYEILREQAFSSKGWITTKTRKEWIRAILDLAPFNQTDGAWLRYVANAGPTDQVRSFLFEVWSDEVGNGDPALHHGNLYTTLLQNLGMHLPALTSRAYADNPDIHELQFIVAVFQLAISLHSDDFFPELLGMTLFLEWEVLSLVPNLNGRQFIGIDPQFWEMHVGIDNASNGHGAKARMAVELYLDQIMREGGQDAMQHEWQRIWRGFVAFASAGYDYFSNVAAPSFDIDQDLDDLRMSRAHPASPQELIEALIERKAHYGSLNHRDKHLGGHRLNDLFEEPEIFLKQLATSPWVVPGHPDESRLLNYLTTFEGPMYKVFNQADLALWRDWIDWLGREGDTPLPKRFITKAESMLILLSELRDLGKASGGHHRYRVADPESPGGAPPLIADFFERSDLRDFMHALAKPSNGWVVPGDPDASPIVVDMARGDRAMGKALDQRFESLGGQIGRQVLIKWIQAFCPIPGETAMARSQLRIPPRWNGKRLIVQQFGMGAVH